MDELVLAHFLAKFPLLQLLVEQQQYCLPLPHRLSKSQPYVYVSNLSFLLSTKLTMHLLWQVFERVGEVTFPMENPFLHFNVSITLIDTVKMTINCSTTALVNMMLLYDISFKLSWKLFVAIESARLWNFRKYVDFTMWIFRNL